MAAPSRSIHPRLHRTGALWETPCLHSPSPTNQRPPLSASPRPRPTSRLPPILPPLLLFLNPEQKPGLNLNSACRQWIAVEERGKGWEPRGLGRWGQTLVIKKGECPGKLGGKPGCRALVSAQGKRTRTQELLSTDELLGTSQSSPLMTDARGSILSVTFLQHQSWRQAVTSRRGGPLEAGVVGCIWRNLGRNFLTM
jgi:hypothetical protein